jgi:protein disulfide-isomerase
MTACALLVQGCGQTGMEAVNDGLPWQTDLPKALEQAKTENKIALLDFTGSDWCGWCIRFDKEVFATSQFKEYADKNLVLVELDFPNNKPQSAELKKANAELKEKYKIEGYPTLVVLDKDGKELGRQVGYSEGGPKAFIAKLEEFRNKK